MKKYGIVSHAELESEHYTLVRNNPAYRQAMWQFYHEAEHEPSNAALYGAPQITNKPLKVHQNQAQIGAPEMTQIRDLLLDLQNRLNKHIDPKKKKGLRSLGIKE